MSSLRVRFAQSVLPHVSTRTNDKRRSRSSLTPGAESATYLPLQMFLYFNVLYTPLWIISSVLALQTKFVALPHHYKFVTVLVYLIMFPVEVGRLYLGYEGNLREKVPELAGFWLLSLLQTPLTIYTLVNYDALALPLERGTCIPLLVLLLAELIVGARTLYLMIGAQALKFHLTQRNFTDRRMATDGGREADEEDEGENIEMHDMS